jgi:hypothetical protein
MVGPQGIEPWTDGLKAHRRILRFRSHARGVTTPFAHPWCARYAGIVGFGGGKPRPLEPLPASRSIEDATSERSMLVTASPCGSAIPGRTNIEDRQASAQDRGEY